MTAMQPPAIHRFSLNAVVLLCLALLPALGSAAGDLSAVAKELQLPDAHVLTELRTLYQRPGAAAATADPVKPVPVQLLQIAHVGGNRLLLKMSVASSPDVDGQLYLVYLDLDDKRDTGRKDGQHAGVDVMLYVRPGNVSMSFHNPAFNAKNTTCRMARDGNDLYVTIAAPLPTSGDTIPVRAYVSSERKVGEKTRSEATSLQARADLPRAARTVELLRDANEKPPVQYRFQNKFVKYEALSEKGLTFAEVAPPKPLQPGRPRPKVPFGLPQGDAVEKAGTIGRQQVAVNVLEEAGVDRSAAAITFGLPLPPGGLFDTDKIVLHTTDGRPLPLQAIHTALWPDRSVKWALLDTQLPVKAAQARRVIVEFGSDASPPAASGPAIDFTYDDRLMTVTTGPLKVQLNKLAFNVFNGVWYDRNGDGKFTDDELIASGDALGPRLLDEKGLLFAAGQARPARFEIEESGPQKLVVRVEGKYAPPPNARELPYMRYVTRLTFRAGSPTVTVSHTHINDYLVTEFTDIRGLQFPLQLAEPIQEATLYTTSTRGSGLVAHAGKGVNVLQSDENRAGATVGDGQGQPFDAGRCPGVITLRGSRNLGITAVVHEFWQRWPKGISASDRWLVFDLLPRQPDAQYGADLPFHLMYPFVSGFYRFKWGTSFTTRISVDFSGKLPPAEVAAEANRPVIAVLPAEWYAQTRAIGDVSAPLGEQFTLFDDYVAKSYAAHVKRRDEQREYGYMNFGDFFGERSRNWGNNEYDRAHGFFMQFVRTGNRDYYRLALEAARHEADVDIVHAYPDPYYVGANHQHSIGHTGTWQGPTLPPQATWSHKYDGHTDASNGHTFAHGMVEAWYLAGDARVMEAAQELGEHIAFAMAPNFKALGTHERSGGWALRAIMALYGVSYDPEYLRAADQIINVALKSQTWDNGGAWAHVLPLDHAGGQPNIVGNNLFVLAVLLNGMTLYHAETGKPEVLESLKAATAFFVRSWNADKGMFPYSATPEGKQVGPNIYATLNLLIGQPIAYVGAAIGDKQRIEIAERAMATVVNSASAESFGKSLAQEMVYTPELMGALQRYYQAKDPAHAAKMLGRSTTRPATRSSTK